MKLATVGDNCIDYYGALDKYYPGGNPINVAVYFVRLGGEASYTGVVGTDVYGQKMIDAVRAKDVDVSHLRRVEGKTAITQVEVVDGDRVFGDYDEGVLADFKLSESDIDFLCSHDLVVSGLWGKSEDYFAEIQNRGTLTAFDAATRPEDEPAKIAIKNTDYFFYATDDGDTEELRQQMQAYHKEGPKYVIVTLGEEGSLVYDGQEFHKYGIIKTEVVDTMGAGDSYIAGYLKGVLEKQTISKCMEMGARNATETIQYQGAW